MKKKKHVRRPGRKPLDTEKLETAKKILKGGGTYKEAALAIGTSDTTIWRYNQKWGF